MPNIRVETRPADSTGNGSIFGPWPVDVLIRSLFANFSLVGAAAQRVFRVGVSLYPGQTIADFLSNGPFAVLGSDGVAKSGGEVVALPNAGPSSVYFNNAGTLDAYVDNPKVQIAIPYNLIIPQRGTIGLFLDNFQAGDSVGPAVLCLEYSTLAGSVAKRGAPPSSKNNP